MRRMTVLHHTVAMYVKARVNVVWDQLLYAFVEKRFRRTFQPVLQDDVCPSVTPQPLAGHKFREAEKQEIITWRQVEIVQRMLAIFQPELSN
jgi:thiosulfate reductase cytochrome b subunit